MGRKYRNTPRSQGDSLARLGRAYDELASQHRIQASKVARDVDRKVDVKVAFAEWIGRLVELAAEAERLLALEVELARKNGVTWQEVGDALGVSKQAAHDRFSTYERWNKSRRISQLGQVRHAEGYRYFRENSDLPEGALPPFRRLRQSYGEGRKGGGGESS